MRKTLRARPFLESLEDRSVPATIKYFSGVLQISALVDNLALTQKANNTFQVQEGAKSPITYAGVSSINVTVPSSDLNVSFNLGTFTYAGALLINAGDGNYTFDLVSKGGSDRGNVTILSGNGDNTVNVNTNGTGPMTIGGTFQVVAKYGANAVFFNNPTQLLTIQGNVSLTGINTIDLTSDQADQFGADFSASLGVNNGTLNFIQDAASGGNFTGVFSAIKGNLSITGGPFDDTVATGTLTIGKNMTLNLGQSSNDVTAGNSVFLGIRSSGVTTVKGSLSYTGGAGVDFVDFANTTVLGSATFNFGDGADSIALDEPFFPTVPTYIGGNLTINHGNGTFTTFPFDPPNGDAIMATIGGNVYFNLGNGDNTIAFDGFSVVGGKVVVRTGNGNNLLEFLNNVGSPNTQSFILDVIFGNGNDTVTLNNPHVVLSGSIDGGGGMNTFNQLAGTLLNITLSNF